MVKVFLNFIIIYIMSLTCGCYIRFSQESLDAPLSSSPIASPTPAPVDPDPILPTSTPEATPTLLPISTPTSTPLPDTTPPSVSISSPAPLTITGSGNTAAYEITFTDATQILLQLSDLSLMTTGSASCSLNLSGSGLSNRTVTLSQCQGAGTVALVVASGAAQDIAGNLSTGVVATTALLVYENTVQFQSLTSSGLESSSPAQISVELAATSATFVTVEYTIGVTSTATGSGTDYTLAAGTITFNPGETSKNISITIVDDGIEESSETIELSLSSPTGSLLGAKTTHTYTILDNDAQRYLEVQDNFQTEGDVLNYTVIVSGTSPSDITFNWSLVDETTSGASDFPLTSGTGMIAAGLTQGTISVNTLSDLVDERPEKFKLQLSNPSPGNMFTKIRANSFLIDSFKNIKAISSGYDSSCILTEAGTVYCMGMNEYGQLGNGTRFDNPIPTLVSGLSNNITKVEVGNNFVCVLTNLGQVYCWGRNTYSQALEGSTSPQLTPVAFPSLSSNVTDFSVGDSSGCAVQNGGVVCWGSDLGYGKLGNNTSLSEYYIAPTQALGLTSGITKVTVARFHACALKNTGDIACWGRNSEGQLGNGTLTTSGTAIDVSGLSGVALDVQVGEYHTCALITGGTVQCWGDNEDGKVGVPYNAGNLNYPTPQTVTGFHSTVVKIGVYKYHNCALLDTGEVQCWGYNSVGAIGLNDQLFVNQFAPVTPYSLTSGVADLSRGGASYNYSCAILTSKLAKCFGYGGDFALGTADGFLQNNYVQVAGLFQSNPSLFPKSNGENFHECYVGADPKKVWCFGNNGDGQLGIGNTLYQQYPQQVIGLPNLNVTKLSISNYQSCALMSDGSVYCWGSNSNGALGNQTTVDSSTPVLVNNGLPGPVRDIALADGAICAVIDSDGSVYCWGANNYYQLGSKKFRYKSLTAQQLIGLSGPASKIYAGLNTFCALLVSGEVQCWGDNSKYLLGTFEVDKSYTPLTVRGFRNTISELAMSANTACALLTDGSVHCWGSSYNLGDNSILQTQFKPKPILHSSQFTKIHLGEKFGCGLDTLGSVYCWGYNMIGDSILGLYFTNLQINLPVKLREQPVAATHMYGGSDYICIKGTDLNIYCWGDGPQSFDSNYDIPKLVSSFNSPILTVNPVVVNEGQTATMVATLDSVTTATVSFTYSLTGINATAGVDYTDSSGTITIDPGLTSATFSVTTLSNNNPDQNKFININFSNLENAWFATTSSKISIIDDDPYMLAFEGAPTTYANECSNSIKIKTQTFYNEPVNVSTNKVITLAGQGSGSFYADANCSVTVTQATINSGSSFQLFYFKSATPGPLIFNASATNLTSGLFNHNILSKAPATRLEILGAYQLSANQCSNYFLQSIDTDGNPVAVAGPTTATFTLSGRGKIYSDSNCTNETTTLSLNSSSTYSSFYFKSSNYGNESLVANAAGLTGLTFYIDIVQNSVSRIAWFGLQSVNTGSCNEYELQIQDAYGNPNYTNAIRTITITGYGSGAFHSSAGCSSATAASVNIATQNYKNKIYFTDNTKENLYLIGTNGTTKGYHPLSVTDGTPTYKLTLSGPVTAGTTDCSTYILQTKETSDLDYPVPSDLAVTLAGKGTGAFYTLSNCSVSVTSATISSSLSSGTFYFKATTSQSLRFTGTAAGYQSAALSVVIGSPTITASRVLLNGPSLITAGSCQQYTTDIYDTQYNTALITGADKWISFSGNQGASFYSDASCSVTSGSVSVVVGSSSSPVYFKSNLKQNFALAVSASGLTGGTLNVQVDASTINKLKFEGRKNIVKNECSKLELYTRDFFDNEINNVTDQNVNLVVQSGTATFYSDNNCNTTITQTTILTGTSKSTLYIKAPQIGPIQIKSVDQNSVLSTDILNLNISRPISKISASYGATCILTEGSLYCRTDNAPNYSNNYEMPANFRDFIQLPGLTSNNIIDIKVSQRSICALLSTQEFKCVSNSLTFGTDSYFLEAQTAYGIGAGSGTVGFSTAWSGYHTCFLINTGQVYCTGSNGYGELGLNGQAALTDALNPVYGLGAGSGVSKVAVSQNASCALFSNGDVKCWGDNSYGKLGIGTSAITSSSAPMTVTLGTFATDLQSSNNHYCALLIDSSMKCWGTNTYGQIGNGTTSNVFTPTIPTGLSSGVAQISLSSGSSCALLTNGTIKCWGYNGRGALGDGTTSNRTTPVDTRPPSLENITRIESFEEGFCAYNNYNASECWGSSLFLQTTTSIPFKVPIPTLESSIVDVQLGGTISIPFGCALTNTGLVKCWGNNMNGNLGDNTTTDRSTAVNVQGLTDTVAQISTSYSHSCARLTNGNLQCWGANTNGKLGDGTTTTRKTAVTTASISNVIDVNVSTNNTCAIDSSHQVYCWGGNTNGQIGDGTTTVRYYPTQAIGINDAVQVLTEQNATCILTLTGGVKCWGNNMTGQLGNGLDTVAIGGTSIPIGLESGVQKIFKGYAQGIFCAQKNNDLYCWGDNSYRVFAFSLFGYVSTPKLFENYFNLKSIVFADRMGCFIDEQSKVSCWGAPLFANLGDGTFTVHSLPKPIVGVTGQVTKITTNGVQTCFVEDGGVYCFGRNYITAFEFGFFGFSQIGYFTVPTEFYF